MKQVAVVLIVVLLTLSLGVSVSAAPPNGNASHVAECAVTMGGPDVAECAQTMERGVSTCARMD